MILAALRRRWRIAVVAGVVAAAICAAGVWSLRQDKYAASAVLRIAQSEQKILQDGGPSPEGEMYFRTQIALLRSRPVLQTAVRDERVRQLPLIQGAADPVALLEKQLIVEPIPGTDLLRVTLTARGSGTDLAPVLNAAVEAYLAAAARGEQTTQAAHLSSLQKAYDGTEEKLRQLRESFQGLTRTLKGGDSKILSLRQQVVVDEYASLKRELVAADARDRDLELKIATLRQGRVPEVVWVPIQLPWAARLNVPFTVSARGEVNGLAEKDLDADPRVAELEKQVAKARDRLSRFEAVSADPNSPTRTEYRRLLERAETDLRVAREERRREAAARHLAATADRADRALRDAETERAALRRQREALQADVAEMRKELDRLGVDSVDLELKRAEIERSETFLRSIWERKERLEVELKGARQRVTVVSAADDATVLNKSARLQEAVAAGGGGLMAVLLALAVIDLRRNRIHTPTDVSQGLRLRVLGALPTLPTQAVVRRGTDKYKQFEAIDDLRTTLLAGVAAGSGDGGQVLLVTSGLPGEGKTTLATQLAASFARVGRRTLLVDCDLRSPSLHLAFGLDAGPGVCDVLTGTVRAEAVVRPTWMTDLDLLVAGVLTPTAESELARPAAVRRVLDELRGRYDFVVIDSSPVLLVPDALMVASCVDGLLISVRPGVSEVGEVYAAYERLSELRLPVLGVVVNGVPSRAAYYPTADRSAAMAARA